MIDTNESIKKDDKSFYSGMKAGDFIRNCIKDLKGLVDINSIELDMSSWIVPTQKVSGVRTHVSIEDSTHCRVCLGGAFLYNICEGGEAVFEDFPESQQRLAKFLDRVRTGSNQLFISGLGVGLFDGCKELNNSWIVSNGLEALYSTLVSRADVLDEKGVLLDEDGNPYIELDV